MTKYDRIISKRYLEDAIKSNEYTLQNLRELEKKEGKDYIIGYLKQQTISNLRILKQMKKSNL